VICRSNLHQIAVGSRSYSTDTRYMPNGYESGTGWIVWVPEIYQYASDPNLFYCPTAPAVAKWKGVRFGSGLPAQYGYKQDQIRIHASENFSYGHNNGGSSDSSVPSLGVGDHVGGGWNRISMVKSGASFIDEDIMDGTGRSEFPADRHDGGAHIAFGDGHVEHILQKYLIFLGSEGTVLPERRRMWNNDNEPH
jgi:prepilin-type processing-associated H-X9-DG protein